jgi:iron complex transport system permease protein
MTKKIWLLTFVVVAFAFFALSLGATAVNDVWGSVLKFNFQSTEVTDQIIWQIRAPRILGAIILGMILAVAGVLAQGSTNNPLADPAFLGTTAGAALGVVIGVLANTVSIASIGAIGWAACGALFSTLLTFWLARNAMQLIIIGIAVSATLTAIVGILITIADRSDVRSVTFWSLGSLSLLTWSNVVLLAVVAIAVIVSARLLSPRLDLLSLGDSQVRHSGRDPQRIRLIAFLILSIAIATAVSQVGTISFLALAAPHIARSLVGPSHRYLVGAAAVIGALILLVADTAARSVAPPQDLPIGLLISLIGAPVLILALKRGGVQWR